MSTKIGLQFKKKCEAGRNEKEYQCENSYLLWKGNVQIILQVSNLYRSVQIYEMQLLDDDDLGTMMEI